ncbi:superoxide dismutase [Ni] [Coraliomargarita algicola]|uniref:Superoxide dismutase [Ni] n=1 Tax=Coraliomargarita algicola TaxID=3092156 RepID=A0ABZ0RK00_9BACT|nr:superoxide dismutase [Ni] [Coraliomargarita sp. J2-16]WPJ96525.1 superoxide dismutase [Ni] [Coraliomargarita sp. J2-16]
MKALYILTFTFVSLFSAASLSAHCQVPCGIYGDELKFGELEQHVETIAKAAKSIREIAGKETLSAQDQQQLIRWTNNKESHAQKIIDETANYFLAQRIKPGADHYAEKLEVLHHIIVYSMKSKQSVEAEPVETLSAKLAAFKGLYLDHSHEHHTH